MATSWKSNLKACLALLVGYALLVSTQPVAAQQHIVPLGELQGTLRSAAEQRAKNTVDLERVLSYPAAAKALRKAGVSQDQMRRAVSVLDDVELARLADQARASEQDVQAGLITGILATIGLIVVIIIVVALVADARPAPGSSGAALG